MTKWGHDWPRPRSPGPDKNRQRRVAVCGLPNYLAGTGRLPPPRGPPDVAKCRICRTRKRCCGGLVRRAFDRPGPDVPKCPGMSHQKKMLPRPAAAPTCRRPRRKTHPAGRSRTRPVARGFNLSGTYDALRVALRYRPRGRPGPNCYPPDMAGQSNRCKNEPVRFGAVRNETVPTAAPVRTMTSHGPRRHPSRSAATRTDRLHPRSGREVRARYPRRAFGDRRVQEPPPAQPERHPHRRRRPAPRPPSRPTSPFACRCPATRSWPSWAAAGWASSTRPGSWT